MAVCCGLVVGGSYLKEKRHTKVLTCLVMLIGSSELLMFLLMTSFAYSLEKPFIGTVSLFASIMQIVSNGLFMRVYLKDTLADRRFSEWLRKRPVTGALVKVGIVWNFKIGRATHCGFFRLEGCTASFKESQLNLHRHLRMITLFHLVFIVLPVVVADLAIFAGVEWGHQLAVLGIETFLIEILLCLLTYFEFKDPEWMYTDEPLDAGKRKFGGNKGL
jgi:hypothetical protein